MAYKQSPFPMIKGTSPVKQLGLLLKAGKLAAKYGKKAVKFVKKTIKGDPQKKADEIRRQEVRRRYGGPDWQKGKRN